MEGFDGLKGERKVERKREDEEERDGAGEDGRGRVLNKEVGCWSVWKRGEKLARRIDEDICTH